MGRRGSMAGFKVETQGIVLITNDLCDNRWIKDAK